MIAGRQESTRSGFTLIELVVVMAIVGIMAVAVGGPTLANVNSVRARAAGSRLAADIRYMQRTAMASGLRTWVVFNTGANNYRLYMEDRANPGKAGRLPVLHPFDQTSGAVQFGSGPFANVSLTSVNINSTSELEYDNFGTPYDASGTALSGAGVISLSNGVTLTVHPVGGFAERSG